MRGERVEPGVASERPGISMLRIYMSCVGPVNKSRYDKLVTHTIRITLAFFFGAILARAALA